jgi:UDP-N-acetylmuramoyl-L-alanyl-D-glutamate--2,6-diaminopimelate ligase
MPLTRKFLQDLIRQLPGLEGFESSLIEVSGVVSDSRQVRAGNVFVAVCGGTADGHRYIPDAIQRGAVAVVGELPLEGLSVPYVQVVDSRWALAQLSAAYYDFPARQMVMIGVTGTDGKTTTANLIYEILKAARLRAGMISTVNAVIGDQLLDTGFHVTTPDAQDVQRYLAQMASAGLTHAVIEVTSHGLSQRRVAACDFDIAVVTNITHEHLDYHGSYEAYRAAKGLLFSSLSSTSPKVFQPPRGAALNRDDSSYEYLESITEAPKLSYGLSDLAQVRAELVRQEADGLHFLTEGRGVTGEGFHFPVHSNLVGEYNISNCLAAIAVTKAIMGIETADVQRGIKGFLGVPGRMERIEMGQDFIAIVDFAHTPNALRRALEAARKMTMGRLIVAFGSAGLRDRQKRRMMAETSAELADLTVITAEDPRTESLNGILAEMASGLLAKGGVEGATFWRVPDRGEAIRLAVSMARPGDLVMVCGKGHEQSMCFGEIEYAWDDRIAMRAALADHLHVPGPQMPFLPTQGNDWS